MQFRFHDASLEALGISLPDELVSSDAIERGLEPTYARLGLVPGRLEAMTGIRARRHFPEGTRPTEIAIRAAEDCFSRATVAPRDIDCLIFASVCRDFVEPASATVVHHRLGLSEECLLFDLSNACLGWLNGIVLAASLVDAGRARHALVVSGEDAGPAVRHTMAALNADPALTRQSLKRDLATLTLGSGGVAGVVTRGRGARILGGAFSAATALHTLCQGETGERMATDSEAMLREGVALAARTWSKARAALAWTPATPAVTFCHQVGKAHRALLLEKLELDPVRDFSTFERLGNMGSASVGVTMTLGARAGRARAGDAIACLGIGSGLVCGMLGLCWSDEVKV